MKTWFTSDLHFGHKNLLRLGKGRPFETIEEHDQALIDNWNKRVAKGDVVYVLGDVSLRGDIDFLRERLSKLNGAKHLIIGNHDRAKEHACLLNENIWQSMRPYLRLKTQLATGEKVVCILSHYPILEFDGAYRSYVLHLYGHIHDIVSYDDIYKKLGFRAIHVGVDTNNFMPISLDEAWNKSNILLEKLDEN